MGHKESEPKEKTFCWGCGKLPQECICEGGLIKITVKGPKFYPGFFWRKRPTGLGGKNSKTVLSLC